MDKFSLYKFLYEQELGEEEPELEPSIQGQSPPTAGPVPEAPGQQPQQPAPPEATPEDTKAPQPENRSAFRDVLGSTISDINYEPAGSAGGRIKIKTADGHNPLEISWVGQKVTVTKPDGQVIMLSSGGE